ncbi:glycerol-3-phosphate 1-O-acyltransferase PlsY [Nereida ignava]|uniref:Glycerol-3-phosphate acyltransferase n=1 Tax=Nereida ignava TaxID=282199 RepID=A0A0U1NKY7_9RHOB|nr:glycerol-3-phosphate 1-O-acyltransferase PlsY [Nereida ignava]CRK75390.1 G3P acyltransferase [Nereida ignava]SFJ54318.1 acyl-phosphate glycerol-3-phosphate acyltransferase [Nereida ignava DSM 16309]
MTIITLLLAALAGYLFGAIPFGIVMAKVFGLGDLRAIGSGNIGATNVLRTGNKLAAFLTLILDAGKAGIAVLLAGALFGELAGLVAGLAAFVGHCYPVWLGFKGGKGVATFFGLIFAACWPVGLAAGATWLVIAALSRYSSLSALIASALAPVYAAALGGTLMVPFLIILALLIFWRHTENIQRLLKGTEGKIGSK